MPGVPTSAPPPSPGLDRDEAVSRVPAPVREGLTIGVALGGGSARGYAHLGALASLERHGLAPHVIAGTSFGAVIGALYATGRGLDELVCQASAMRRRDVLGCVGDIGLHRAALFTGGRLEAYFDRLLEGRTFADLERTLLVVTTDIDTGERVVIDSGPLAAALRASASLPGVFAPVQLGGRRLIDGGIGSPVPLDTLDGTSVDVAIGIGAGMQASDSHAIRVARRVVGSRAGRDVQRWAMRTPPRTAVGRLGRAIAYAAEGWLLDERTDPGSDASVAVAGAAAPSAGAGGPTRLEVHTHPTIHWLNFHRAAEAIESGGRALDAFMPKVQRALAGLRTGAAAAATPAGLAAD